MITTRRITIFLVIAAVIGYGTFAILFPRHDPAARWNYRLDFQSAIARAHESARSYGMETTSWTPLVSTWQEGQLYLHHRRGNAEIKQLSSVDTLVILRNPSKAESFRLRLDTSGKPVALQIRRRSAVAAKSEPAEGERIASNALRAFGVPLDQYVLAGRDTLPDGAQSFRWERQARTLPELKFIAEAEIAGREIRKLTSDWHVSGAFSKQLVPERKLLKTLGGLLFVVIHLAAVVLFIRATIRREMPGKLAARFAIIVFLVSLAVFFSRSGFTEEDFQNKDDPESSLIVGNHDFRDPKMFLAAFSISIGLALLFTLYWSGGFPASRKEFPRATATFEQFLRGNIYRRSVGHALFSGVLSAGLVSAIPYLLASTPFFGAVLLQTPNPGLIRMAFGRLFENFIDLHLVFALVVPLLLSLIRLRPLAWAAASVAGWFLLFENSHFPAFDSVSTAAVILVYLLLFRHSGLLGCYSAAFAANALHQGATLLAQPSLSLHTRGFILLAVPPALAALGWLTHKKGREDDAVTLPSSLKGALGERERIQADFELARQAQEKMLPAQPPEIPGFAIAAICKPAKQVGGDLYDFLPLPGGQIGIAVADVSGKGVPAALFMTMTKGLLVAASEDRDNPIEILSDVNAGLHSLSAKNVFVTMFFGVLDPAARRLRFVRAGHNPTFWRQAAQNRTVSLTPGGIALGMTSPKLFDRSLKIEQVDFEEGDTLFIYSDGVTEAMNGASDEYGDERFLSVIEGTDLLDAAGAREAIVADVASFVGTAPAHDDLTLVVLRALADVSAEQRMLA